MKSDLMQETISTQKSRQKKLGLEREKRDMQRVSESNKHRCFGVLGRFKEIGA